MVADVSGKVGKGVLLTIGLFVKTWGDWGSLAMLRPAQLCEWRVVATLKVNDRANFLQNCGSFHTGM